MQAKILQLIFKHSYRAIVKEPDEVLKKQDALWRFMIDMAKDTSFGTKFNFADIHSLENFKTSIPIQNYESLEADILKMTRGEKNVLWPGKIKMFAKSSGTSNAKSKFIPLSKVSLVENHYKGGRNILSIFCHNFPDKNIFEGKNLSVAGSFIINDAKVKIGDLSSLLLLNLPTWVQLKRLPSISSALMLDWEAKIEKISDEIIHENLSSFSGVPSWNLILLQKVLIKSGAKNLVELWPSLQLYMHGGVHFEPYRKSFEDLIGKKDFVFLETYNASEGFFAIQDSFDKRENGMLLLCNHGVFYEFLPLKELDNPLAKTLQLNEVIHGENYALIITTKSGLWRYMIGDTIRFVSLNPFRIILSGRIKYFINIFGEELIEENANNALQEVCKNLACSFQEYTVAPILPDSSGKGGHEWLIEFDQSPENMGEFTIALDEALKRNNSDYEAKRSGDLALQLPVVKALPKRSFLKWLKEKNKLGAQHKVPRLQNNRRFIEDMIALTATN